MRIGIDVDGVLANFTRGYATVIRQVSGRDLLTEEMIVAPPTWYWDRAAGYTKEEENAAWGFIMTSPTFWADLEPFAGMKAVQNILTDHDVYFITSRMGVKVKAQTEAFLYNHLPHASTPTVLISDNKGPLAVGLKLDVFIDDRDKNIIEVSQASPTTDCYILDYPYNAHVEDTTNITRCYSVLQALQEAGVVDYNYN